MRDLGGVMFLTVVVGAFGNSMFSYNKLENHLVEKLYEKGKPKSGSKYQNEGRDLDAES